MSEAPHFDDRARAPMLSLLVLRCANLEQSREFYEALGIVFSPEQHGSGPRHYSAHLGTTVLELYPATEPSTPIRIGMLVVDVSATVRAVSAFAACVLRFEPERAQDFALVRDPDGNKIELSAVRAKQ